MTTATEQGKRMDMESMIKEYTRLGTPGAPHQMLAKMAGSWSARIKTWMEPGTPPVEGSGSSEMKMILEGRFLQETFTGSMMGSVFTGLSLTGYDNHSETYVSSWMDSMGTSMLYFTGKTSQDGKTLTMEARHHDKVRGPLKWRSVAKMVDDNTRLFEMFSIDQNGTEEKEMEVTYTRKR